MGTESKPRTGQPCRFLCGLVNREVSSRIWWERLCYEKQFHQPHSPVLDWADEGADIDLAAQRCRLTSAIATIASAQLFSGSLSDSRLVRWKHSLPWESRAVSAVRGDASFDAVSWITGFHRRPVAAGTQAVWTVRVLSRTPG